MDLGYLLIVVIVFAVVMYVINNFFIIDAKLKQFINLILLLIFCVWLFGFSGIFYGHRALIR
jgi:hypothetical protein